jgi:KipI family sensor histidine kinase inhibitor
VIYDEPTIANMGDCCLIVEFGSTAEIELSLSVLALQQRLESEKLPGIVELAAATRQLGIYFDRTRTTRDRVRDAVEAAIAEGVAQATVESRHHILPVWFGDPWTIEEAALNGVPPNLDYVAELNGMSTDKLVETLCGGLYWVSLVGFTPGTYLAYAIQRDMVITAPKYQRPRTNTPSRTVALAGAATCGYTLASPGGYQMIGRFAVDTYQPSPTMRGMPEDGVLIRAGDRITYRSVMQEEYESIRAGVQSGDYQHEYHDGLFGAEDLPATGTA